MLLRISRALRDRPFLVVLAFLGVYGFATVDVADFAQLSAAPWQLHANPGKQFLQFSPLPFFLGYPLTNTIGASASFAVVMLGGLGLCALALRRLVTSRYGVHSGDAALMFFATPLLIVLTQYIGKSDPYVVAFFLLVVGSPNPVLQSAFGALLVVSHFEIGLLVLGSAAFLRLIRLPSAILGGIAGALLTTGYHYWLLPAVPQSRADIGVALLSEALGAVMATPVLHVVGLFGPFWWCVAKASPVGGRWLVVFVATAAVASVTLDFTRVFTLVGLPLVVSIVDRLVARAEARGADHAAPRWLTVLPLFAFFQMHLISTYVYDSRLPEMVGKVVAYVTR